ncbi:MAG: AarF/UbiB family protein [Phycisphaerae bacterium]
MSIFSVPMTIRSTQRLGQIALTLIRHGFGPFVWRLKLRRHIPWSGLFQRRSAVEVPDAESSLGKRLAASFEELGPVFVKFGQLLSSRPDIVPPDIAEDLRLLQDRVAPFPTQQAHEIILHELKRDVKDLFLEFGPEPLASGSIAQVYLAKTKNGQRVIVKVRRPGIEQVLKLDLYLLKWVARNIEKHIPELHLNQPMSIVDEFAQSINREMDFLNEASITDRIHQFFGSDPNLVVPSVRWDLSSSKVLTLSYVTGKNFHEAITDPTMALDKPKLAGVLIETFMRQVLELGVFHADPHPGNFIIIPPDRIGIIDFGMAGQLDRHRNTSFILLLMAAHYRYMDIAMDILSEMNAITPATDVELLKRDLAILLDKWSSLPLKLLDLHTVFNEISTLASEYRVILPRDFVLIGKSLVMIGGTALMLDPNVKPTEIIAEKVQEALVKMCGKENLTRETILAFWHGGMLLKDLPHQFREFSRKLLRGQLRIQMDVIQMDNFIRELDHSSNRLSFAIIVAAVIIGSSLIFNIGVGPHGYGFYLGLTGYLVAGIMGLWLVVAIIRSGKLS